MSNDNISEDFKSDNVSFVSEGTLTESTIQPDSLSTDIELDGGTEGSMDLREITQSILDLEETQTTCSNFPGSSTCMIPSSPPPSYEHVLAETMQAEEEAAALGETRQQQQHQQADSEGEDEEDSAPPTVKKGIEIMHKSHKEFYRAVAKQWGITCKMSDHCRCLDCQSMYFECEYDQDEQEKTDGGLGAGTPMFISEVIHGTACVLL